MLNIAVLVSGGGTNLQALLDSEARGENPNGKITLVVASKPGVFALERAAKAGVEGCVVRRKDYATSEEFDAALLETLDAIDTWRMYRNEVIHSLMNKRMESVQQKLSEQVEQGVQLARQLDAQVTILKKNNRIRKAARLPIQ